MVVDGEEAVAAVAVDDVTLNVGVLDEIDEIVEDELGADVGGDEEDGGDEIDVSDEFDDVDYCPRLNLNLFGLVVNLVSYHHN